MFGFAKEFFDPAALDESGCVSGPPAKCELAFAQIQTTTRDEFSGNPPLEADSVNIVFHEGEAFFLDGTRTGRLALVAVAGIFDNNSGSFRPRQMGIRRRVFPQHGVTLDNQDIELTIDLDEDVDVSLPDAPLRAELDTRNIGHLPTITRVVPFLQLGGEGAFNYTQAVEGKRNHALHTMPKVPGELLTFISGAYTTDGPRVVDRSGPHGLVTNLGAVTLTAGSTTVTNVAAGTVWSSDNNPFDGQPDVIGAIFVTTNPVDGSRFASIVAGCEHPGSANAIDFTTCGDGPDADFNVDLELDVAPSFSSTAPQAYHIGDTGLPSSEVIQDGAGDLRGGITIQPVLGLPEVLSPLEDGVLVDRTLRWKAAPGQQPTIHDMFLFEPFQLSTIWEFYVDGTRTKVVVPQVPELDAILSSTPTPERICLNDPTIDPACAFFGLDTSGQKPFVPPGDMARGGMAWQHEAIFTPGLDFNSWSLLDIGSRGRRSFTTDVHVFVHGN